MCLKKVFWYTLQDGTKIETVSRSCADQKYTEQVSQITSFSFVRKCYVWFVNDVGDLSRGDIQWGGWICDRWFPHYAQWLPNLHAMNCNYCVTKMWKKQKNRVYFQCHSSWNVANIIAFKMCFESQNESLRRQKWQIEQFKSKYSIFNFIYSIWLDMRFVNTIVLFHFFFFFVFVYGVQVFKQGKWENEITIEEPYEEGCMNQTRDSDRHTVYCHCRGSMCNNAPKDSPSYHTDAMAVIFVFNAMKYLRSIDWSFHWLNNIWHSSSFRDSNQQHHSFLFSFKKKMCFFFCFCFFFGFNFYI